jgi:putative endonuclease
MWRSSIGVDERSRVARADGERIALGHPQEYLSIPPRATSGQQLRKVCWKAECAMPEKQFYVYMLASRIGGTLYIGVTGRLIDRVSEHRDGVIAGFTKRYRVHRLVWFESHHAAEDAIRREKQLKEWRRAWKIRLIQELNPNWDDLFPALVGQPELTLRAPK